MGCDAAFGGLSHFQSLSALGRADGGGADAWHLLHLWDFLLAYPGQRRILTWSTLRRRLVCSVDEHVEAGHGCPTKEKALNRSSRTGGERLSELG